MIEQGRARAADAAASFFAARQEGNGLRILNRTGCRGNNDSISTGNDVMIGMAETGRLQK